MIFALFGSLTASEGLWPVDTQASQLPLKEMGFNTTPKEHSKAIFKYMGCTAFVFGEAGLIFTNQHCIKNMINQQYPQILEAGFAAPSPNEAIEWPVPIHWYGEEMDISLIFVPPDELAFWGGEDLNWRWPRHSADFAIFQVSSHDDKQKLSEHGLQIGSAAKNNDPLMVLGFPARTFRHEGLEGFSQDINEIRWEHKIQTAWEDTIHQEDFNSTVGVTVNTRLEFLSRIDTSEIERNKTAVFNSISSGCHDDADLELKYLTYLRWSCAYLDTLLSLLSGNEPHQNLNVVNPGTELALLQITLNHDPNENRSWRWNKKIRAMLDSITELPPVNQTQIEEWQIMPEKMKKSPFGSFAHLIHAEESSLKRKIAEKECRPYNKKVPYPDANGTLRSSFGIIEYGETHPPFTFAKAPENKLVPANFTSSVDIGLGSSGSPTLNSNGKLVGVVFDMNTDALLSDWLYQPNGRTIHVDVRYIIWMLENSPSNWVLPLLKPISD